MNLSRTLNLAYAVCYFVFGVFLAVIFYLSYPFGFDYAIYHSAGLEAAAGGSPYLPYIVGQSYLYHPAFLLLITPLTALSTAQAAVVWTLVGLLCYAATVALLWRWLGLTTEQGVKAVFLAFASAALYEAAWMGQVNMLVVFCATVAVLQAHQRPALAGLMLAVAIIAKTTPALLLVYWICLRQWRALLWAGLFFAAFSLASLTAFGGQTTLDFVQISAQIGGESIANSLNLSPASGLQRLGLPYGAAVWLQRGLALALLLPALLLAYRQQERHWSFAALLVVMVGASPVMWGHHLVLALPAVLLLLHHHPRWTLTALILMQLEGVSGNIAPTLTGLWTALGWLIMGGLLLRGNLRRLSAVTADA